MKANWAVGQRKSVWWRGGSQLPSCSKRSLSRKKVVSRGPTTLPKLLSSAGCCPEDGGLAGGADRVPKVYKVGGVCKVPAWSPGHWRAGRGSL